MAQRGRKSQFDPKYCDEIIDFMARGYSIMAFAGNVRVSRSVVYDWMDRYPEFKEAADVARAARVTFLEEGLLGAENGSIVTSRIFALKNAAPDEWRDKQQVEHSGTVDLVERIIVDPANSNS